MHDAAPMRIKGDGRLWSARKLKELALGVVAVAVSLLIVEGLTRHLLPRPGFLPFPSGQPEGLIVPHPVRFYAYTPNFSAEVHRETYQNINTNSLGLRDDEVTPGERIDILAVGDSFTMGFRVQAEDAWPAQLENNLNALSGPAQSVRVLNAGVSGYSLTQIRQHIEELIDLAPELVVIGLFAGGHGRIGNPYRYHEGHAVLTNVIPRTAVTEGGFLSSNFGNRTLRRVHLWHMEHFYFGARLMEFARALRWRLARPIAQPPTSGTVMLEDLLQELSIVNDVCKSHDTGLVVLLVNPQEEDGEFIALQKEYNSVVETFCTKSGISVFDPIPYFEATTTTGAVFRMGRDPHWSELANALVGKELARFLLSERR